MGQVDAMLSNSSTKDTILKSASESLVICPNILRSTAAILLSTIITDPSLACGTDGDAIFDDINFGFLNDGNIDFGLVGFWFVRQRDDKAWS